MKRFRIETDNSSNVCGQSAYIVNSIVPVSINTSIGSETFEIYFLFNCTGSEGPVKKYISIPLSYSDDKDKEFVKNHSMNLNNIIKDENAKKIYSNITKDFSSMNEYKSDMDITVCPEKRMYHQMFATGIKPNREVELIKLLLSRALFVKLNLFFVNFSQRNTGAETIFINDKFTNVEYVTVDNINIYCCCKDENLDFVTTNYIAKHGPNYYRFNFLSPALNMGRRLKYPVEPEQFQAMYAKDVYINNMFIDPSTDTLYLAYHKYEDLCFKKTIMLKLSKKLYERTNFLDLYKIYD